MSLLCIQRFNVNATPTKLTNVLLLLCYYFFYDLQVNKKQVATGMFSADGEFVPFNKAVPLDNPVEVF